MQWSGLLIVGSTVASNPNEKFGHGNVSNVINKSNANNSQKRSSFIPTVLFGN